MKFRILVVALIITTVTIVSVGMLRLKRDKDYTSSCANHFINLRLALEVIAENHPDLQLPATSNTREVLQEIFHSGGENDMQQEWLKGPMSACPQSFKRNGSIGYVYIGDGLRIGDVVDKCILVLFCPGENHRGLEEHCHAWNRKDGICVHSNREMISELENAITRGRSGEVAYSKRAFEVLETEIAKRRAQP